MTDSNDAHPDDGFLDRLLDVPSLIARTPSGSMYLYRQSRNGQINPAPKLLATGWDAYDQIVAPVDWNGDGRPDLIARMPDGTMWISLGRADHSLAPPVEMSGIREGDEYSTIVGGGEWTSTHHQDLVGRRGDGTLWLFNGKGATSFAGSLVMDTDWNDFS